jgi:hypothetical protein
MTTPTPTSITGNPITDAVVPAAVNLVWAVRTEERDEVLAALKEAHQARLAAGGHDRTEAETLRTLVIVLAGMVPDDRSPRQLLAWLQNPAEYMRLRQDGYDTDTASSIAAQRAGVAA